MDVLSQLATYTSVLDRSHIGAAGDAPNQPGLRALQGAVLFTDFVGFTSLAEWLARKGPVGSEKLSEVLNSHYGILTDAIAKRGGDVLLFAGDALVALFEDESADLRAATRRAVRAALDMQAALGVGRLPDEVRLGLRATIGAGALVAQRVGGVDGRWLTLVGGPALEQVFAADALARAGDVLAAAPAWRAIADGAHGEPRGGAGVTLVERLSEEDAPGIATKVAAEYDVGKAVEQLVLPLVRDRLLGGHSDFLAEFRDASAVFVRLPTVDPGTPADLPRLHEAAIVAQEEANRLDGTLYQMLRDDKGCALVLAFGLPGQAHDDDAARAADAALAVCHRLRTLAVSADAGVATGVVFCGSYGGTARRHYGIMGPTMNRAARLMQAAAGRVVVDHATRVRGERWMEFRNLPPLTVKGIDVPVHVSEAVARRTAHAASHARFHTAMIGRSREGAVLGARVAALRGDGGGGAVIIEAEAGMGKSSLLRHAVQLASARTVRVLEGAADSIEVSTAYLALRPIIAALLEVPSASPDDVRAAVLRRLERLPPRLRDLAPLLNLVLPLDFADNELTAQMSGTIRAANLTNLLLGLVEQIVADGPVMFALEDLHWMDDASLQFCARVLDALPGVLLVATLRPVSPEPPALTRLRRGDGREKLGLDTFAPDEIVELVRRRLGARTIPVAVKDLIVAKAEGNPFYSEEIAIALRESGVIAIENGECHIAVTQEFSTLNLPGTVKGVITSRIDRLAPAAQVALKVASVLGRSFELPTLQAVLPATIDAVSLPMSLDELQAAELLVPESNDSSRYGFRHALIQETTYSLLPFAQRRPLHAAAAEHVERAHAADLAPFSARLAHHWLRAERPEKAVHYLGDAGRQALEAHANQSAVEFLEEALKLDLTLRRPHSVDAKRASWHRQLAEGYYSLIQWDQARTHYEHAIRLSGFPAPKFGAATPVEVLKHVASRYAPRLVFGDPARLPESRRAAGIEAMRACDNLQVVYLWQGNQLSLAHTVFEGANIAARTGPSAESSFARAMMGYLLVMAGLHRIAERDLRSAVAMADASGQLLQRVSTNMYLGMSLSLLGRPLEGIPYLQTADDLVGRLGAGLWKHRGKYMLAEPHLMVGNLDVAADLFGASATLSTSVEPPITGFANAMRALCRIRQGRVDEGIALVHGSTGIRLVRDNPIGLQLYNSLGALIEGYLWTGEWRLALEAAREGVAIPERGGDANSFFTGYNGHAAVARLFLTLLEWRQQRVAGAEALPGDDELWSLARRALKNFGKGAKVFPGARSPLLVLEGIAFALQGKRKKAADAWERCRTIASASSMPYEHAMATYELGRHAGISAERDRYLREARETFERLGMPRYAARCSAPGDALHPFTQDQ